MSPLALNFIQGVTDIKFSIVNDLSWLDLENLSQKSINRRINTVTEKAIQMFNEKFEALFPKSVYCKDEVTEELYSLQKSSAHSFFYSSRVKQVFTNALSKNNSNIGSGAKNVGAV